MCLITVTRPFHEQVNENSAIISAPVLKSETAPASSMELVALTTCHILRGDTVTQSHREQKNRSFSESGLQNYTHAWASCVCKADWSVLPSNHAPFSRRGTPCLLHHLLGLLHNHNGLIAWLPIIFCVIAACVRTVARISNLYVKKRFNVDSI